MQEQADTQRTLHQASAALEAAYRRIRQARRNLLELTERSPPQDPQTRTGEPNDFNPGYEAITLTGEQDYDTDEEELAMLRENAPQDTQARLRRYETILALEFQDTDRSVAHDTMPSNTIGSFPLTPSHPRTTHLPSFSSHLPPGHFHPRRSQLEGQLARRRELLHNDPTTTIGRRVAAREAGSAIPGSFMSSWDVTSARFMSAIERDIEQVRTATRQRRTNPVRPEVQPVDTVSQARASRSLDVDTLRRAARNQPLQPRAANSAPPLGPPVESRRQRLGRVSVHPSPQSPMLNQSRRLSVLSNLPVQNLTTPMSAVSRPLLFEEPSSYIPATDVTRQYPNFRDEQNGPVGAERSYVIRRTINADGEEHVHPISFEWSDEEASPWVLPRGQRDELFVDYMSPPRPLRSPPVRYVQRSDTIQHLPTEGNTLPSGTHRRRGWARLDPDGNEIPSDEEEELERVRAELRVNAQYPSRGPLHSNITVPHEYESTLRADNLPRSGLDLVDPDLSWSSGNTPDLVPTVASRIEPPVHQPVSQLSPFCVNPLPMPVESMVMCSKKVQRDNCLRTIIVARHASLAGR